MRGPGLVAGLIELMDVGQEKVARGVGLGGPGNGILEVMVEALVGLVLALLDYSVDDLDRGPTDGAEEEAFSGEATEAWVIALVMAIRSPG